MIKETEVAKKYRRTSYGGRLCGWPFFYQSGQ